MANKLSIRKQPQLDRAFCLGKILVMENEFDDVRYEVINNVIYLMGTPTFTHEAIVAEMIYQFRNHLQAIKSQCKPYGSNAGYSWAPILLEKGLCKKGERAPKLLPDVSILCDAQIKDGTYLPKLIIEIASPSTMNRDFDVKKKIYEAVGVQEYWVINYPHSVHQFILAEGEYPEEEKIYELEENITQIPVSVFEGLAISIDKVYLG
jgi:Uma2 family endonuclease